MIKYRIAHNTFVGQKQTEHSYKIQFSDDGYDWYDLEDEFPESIAELIVKALESAELTHFDDLRPKWVDNDV